MLPKPQISLYIHTPWCIKKCPYCDFNSHKASSRLPENDYLHALMGDLDNDLKLLDNSREITTIFVGGGTPSLLSGSFYQELFLQINNKIPIASHAEITLEANPGTVESQNFKAYRKAGINRLSLGIQSFNPISLKQIGRIHDEVQAINAINIAKEAGFDNINIDIMHSLPAQSLEQGLHDLETALDHQPSHLSWYQLTIEPNTQFYSKTPILPGEQTVSLLEKHGFALLEEKGYNRYEISAFTKNTPCQHNLVYWQFGDYLGIGAGAHGKLTTKNAIIRTQKHRMPDDYLNQNKPFSCKTKTLQEADLVFEAMLNFTRLEKSIPLELLSKQTNLPLTCFLPKLRCAKEKGLIELTNSHFRVTPFGRRFTNDLQALFL